MFLKPDNWRELEPLFFLTTLACAAVLLPARLWSGPADESWPRRLVFLGLGFLIGMAALCCDDAAGTASRHGHGFDAADFWASLCRQPFIAAGGLLFELFRAHVYHATLVEDSRGKSAAATECSANRGYRFLGVSFIVPLAGTPYIAWKVSFRWY